MFPLSNVLGILAAIASLWIVIEMLRKNRLKERHALWWIIAGILALVIGFFPGVLDSAATLVGIEIPSNLIFFVSITILFFACVQNSSELTALEEKTRVLAEEVSLLSLAISEESQKNPK